MGLPEVTLGLIPGGGGITRLTRLLGLETALPLLTEGKRLSPAEARTLGIVNELAATPKNSLPRPKPGFRPIQSRAKPWDTKGYRLPGGDARTPKVAQMLAAASGRAAQENPGELPGPTGPS